MPVVKVKYDGVTSSFDQRMGRKLLLEDPNTTYNRIFIDHQAYDVSTLTPQWNKQFMYEYGAGQSNLFGNGGSYQTGLSNSTGINAGYGYCSRIYGAFLSNDVYPVIDQEYLRSGEIVTQKGTIQTWAWGDWLSWQGSTNSWQAYLPNTIREPLGTYWHTLDFANWPTYKSYTSPVTGLTFMITVSSGEMHIGGYLNSGNPTTGTGPNTGVGFLPGQYSFHVYGPDITQQQTYLNNKSSAASYYVSSTNGTNAGSIFTHMMYEDYTTGYIFGISETNTSTYFNYMNPQYAISNIANSGDTTAGFGKFYWMGTDNVGRLYLLKHQIQFGGEPYSVLRYDPRYQQSTTLVSSATSTNASSVDRRLEPSNIRRDANNRYVFYSAHLNSTTTLGWQPVRFVWDPTNSDSSVNSGFTALVCNVAYPGSNNYSNYATLMSLSGTASFGQNYTIANYAVSSPCWKTKPWQFISNGNVYLTMWMVDQFASWLGNPTPGAAGATRWATPQQRTMITYQVGSNTAGSTPTGNADINLTFHSAYTFPNVVDIPKNFMPLNANGTLMAVVSGSKTNFFTFNNNTGWNSGGVYNTEFRMLGLDNTGRIWGSALDQNNGSLHIVTPSLSLNVVLTIASTNYTYTGTPISTNATINVYDSYSNRIATTVTLTTDGVNTVFTNNGLRSITVSTSSSGDTTVPLTINGGGISNIYVAVNNA